MSIINLFMLLAVTLILIILIPDIFPTCACCRKIKFRLLFKLHKTMSHSLGHHAKKSVCRACCSKYNIDSLYDLELVSKIMQKVEIDLLKDRQSPEAARPHELETPKQASARRKACK